VTIPTRIAAARIYAGGEKDKKLVSIDYVNNNRNKLTTIPPRQRLVVQRVLIDDIFWGGMER
jgi:hypothetical protein